MAGNRGLTVYNCLNAYLCRTSLNQTCGNYMYKFTRTLLFCVTPNNIFTNLFILGSDSKSQIKGSRFTHTKKLQFSKVSYSPFLIYH